jgi:hypothetical protein
LYSHKTIIHESKGNLKQGKSLTLLFIHAVSDVCPPNIKAQRALLEKQPNERKTLAERLAKYTRKV